MARYGKTVNVHCGKKLAGKSRDEILTAVLARFQNVECVQQCLDVIRVTFIEEWHACCLKREWCLSLWDVV